METPKKVFTVGSRFDSQQFYEPAAAPMHTTTAAVGSNTYSYALNSAEVRAPTGLHGCLHASLGHRMACMSFPRDRRQEAKSSSHSIALTYPCAMIYSCTATLSAWHCCPDNRDLIYSR